MRSNKQMKLVKILILVLAISAIVVSVVLSTGSKVKKPPKQQPLPPGTLYTDHILQDINKINAVDSAAFCAQCYKDVAVSINTWYDEGRFGDGNATQNNEWRKILFDRLYKTYAAKFIQQTYVFFKNSSCKDGNTLNFVRGELNTLHRSELLEKRTPIDSSLARIGKIVAGHDRISKFITECQNYSYSSPEAAQRRLAELKTHQGSQLEHGNVPLCKHLSDGLNLLPQRLFDAHVRYLNRKIADANGSYKNYDFCKEGPGGFKIDNREIEKYNKEWDKINGEIRALTTIGYFGVSEASISSVQKGLADKWKAEGKAGEQYIEILGIECEEKNRKGEEQ